MKGQSKTRKRLTTPITCRRHVRCNQTWILAERIKRLNAKAVNSIKGQKLQCGDDNLRTHSHVELHFGAVIWATAKPEKKSTIASNAEMSDIWLTALPVIGQENWGRRSKSNDRLIEAFLKRIFISKEL